MSALETLLQNLETARKIPLSKGQFTIVDADDFERLNKYKWNCTKDKQDNYRVSRSEPSKNYGSVYMGREILGAKKGEFVDHVNGEPLDNRKQNLRLCTQSQNNKNAKLRKDNKTGYKGVYYYKNRNTYYSYIRYETKNICCGYYKTSEEAALAYDFHCLFLYGEFARPNFDHKDGQ